MYCCDSCFKDTEIKGFIFSNATEIGDCNFCNTKNTKVIDPRELEELFQPLVALFKTVEELQITVNEPKLICEKFQDQWNIFNIADIVIIRQLVNTILQGLYNNEADLLSKPVEIAVMFDKTQPADVHEKKWESFAQEIKTKNRFFLTETIDLDLLKMLLASLAKKYDAGKIFYRARVCNNKNGHPLAEMGKPPGDKASSGRANPSGIPYLYVSTNFETTIYESRSSYLDFLSVAEYELIGTLHVVSLRDIAKVSPFIFGDHLENYVVHQKYLARLEKELSKPVRRFDKESDYLPSQYLCEYVKSLGYDAIEYGSSLKDGGINLAVFEDVKLGPRNVAVYEITSLELKTDPVQ